MFSRICFAALVAAFALGGCSDDPQQPRATFPENAIPLAVGNSWSYTFDRADTVSETVEIEERTYYRMSGDFTGDLPGEGVVRYTELGQFVLRGETADNDVVLFDFTLNPGANYVFEVDEPGVNPPVVKVVSNSRSVTVPAGTFEGCWQFSIDLSHGLENDINYYIHPGTGIVKRTEESGVENELVSFTLN